MRDLTKWLGFSLGLHLLGLATLPFFAALQANNVRPIVIDLTFSDVPESVARLPEKRAVRASPFSPVVPTSRKRSLPKVPTEKLKHIATPAAVQSLPKSLPVEQKNETAAGTDNREIPGSEKQVGAGDMIPNAAVSSAGNDKALPGNERQRYLAEHFNYIRDLVRKHLVYPAMAQKMGWSGKAVVAFIVMENGTASNIRLVESSGIPLLDRSALATIKRAAPFPRPPARAEIVLPVLFKLQ